MPELIAEAGALSVIRALLDQYGWRRVLLVTGARSYELCGAASTLNGALKGLEVRRFCGFAVNPQLDDVEKGLEWLDGFVPDVVLTVGGGSAIDMGKLLAVAVPSTRSPREIALTGFARDPSALPIIAVPTTCGTGSEATHFAVVYVDGVKHSIAHEVMRPTVAVLDPTLLVGLPSDVAACSGLDAVCQATESMWSVRSTAESRAYSDRALRLLWPLIFEISGSYDVRCWERMALGAYWAGRSIDISKTTAAHALSYYLTSNYGVPHGHAVALNLAALFRFNSEVDEQSNNDRRGLAHVRKVLGRLLERFGCESVMEFQSVWSAGLRHLGLPASLQEVGLMGSEELVAVASSVNQERLANNPRTLDKEQLVSLLEVSWRPHSTTRFAASV
jgi:alcohol dehydrogenase